MLTVLGASLNANNARDDVRVVLFEKENGVELTQWDEVEDFCSTVGTGDMSCADARTWSRHVGKALFPNLARLSRSVLMAKSSSVPSESAFPRSGYTVRAGRCRLTKEEDPHADEVAKLVRLY